MNFYILAIIVIIIILALYYYLYYRNNSCKNKEQFCDGNKDADIVLYYTSWCGHSKNFLPIWDKFEEYVKTNMNNINAVKVNCENENEKVCSAKGVNGYPTVILYPKNKTEVLFEGNRTVEDLKEFVKKNI